MPEISLKEYFSKLNNLLSERAVDEVLLHCRQILQFYPKNVTAYRFLGRGLVMSGRWEEGRESLRRVLSVIPDDFQAHLALSEANERLGRSDEAIWHLERAFEQRPNDKDIIDALRALYSLHRNINNLKIQLTSAAVARQYARSGAYNQAVDTLRSALSRMNERLDLKLLLAQILQEHGEQEEAAELALEVLGVLPDCLEANKIMAELWLNVNRPSDAQRYVNRLEAVDPYLAVEVAQGYPSEDDAFKLDELDYVRTAQSELASSRLDWLQEIASLPTPAGEVAHETASEDLSDWASAMLSGRNAAVPEPEVETTDEPTSVRFAAIAEEEQQEDIDFTGMFGQPEPADADELEAMFAAPSTLDPDDPMAWLHGTGVEIVDGGIEDARYEDLFDDSMPAIEEEDPMAWLRDSAAGQSMDDTDDAAPLVGTTVEDDDGDPMAWLRDSGLDAERATPVAAVPADDEDDPFAWRGNDSGVTLDDVLSDAPEGSGELESFDWLRDDQVLDEALSLDGLASDDPADVWEGFAAAETDEEEEAFSEEVPPTVPGVRKGLTAMLQEANLDWIRKPAEEPAADDEMDEWMNQFGLATEPKPLVTENPDWLLELDQPESSGARLAGEALFGEEFTLDADEPVAQFAVEAAEEETGMSDEHLHEPVEPEDEDVDWMRSVVSQPDDADEAFEAADAEEALEADIPDWMAALEPESGETDDSEAEPEEAEMPDWLANLQPADVQPASTAGTESADTGLEPPDMSDFPWMADEPEAFTEESEEAESEAVVEMPDWLSEMVPEEANTEPEAVAEPIVEDDLSWLSAAEEAQPDEITPDEVTPVEEAEALEAEIPDWMAALEPEEVESTETMPEAEMSEPEPQPEPELELEPPDASDFPWMADEEEAGEQPAAEFGDFPWMSDEAEESEAPVAAQVPDWLASAGLDDEDVEEIEAVMPFSEEPLPEAEEPVAEAIPGWLSELESESEEADTEPQVAEDDLSWLDDEEVGEEAIAAEQPPLEEDEVEAKPIAEVGNGYDEEDYEPDQEEEYGFLSEADDAFLEATPAHNAPDWLNAMVPGLDVDYEPGSEEYADEDEEGPVDDTAQREFAWLNNLVEEETAATRRPEFAFSRLPSWLGLSSTSPDDGSADDDLPDWPSDDADADVPEWLR